MPMEPLSSSHPPPSPATIDFAGIWLPVVTPLREGRLDTAALRRLVKHAAAQGVAGFMPCGSTGEAAMLDADEQAQVLAAVLDAAGGKPVVMGVSGVRAAMLGARMRQLAQDHPRVAGFLVAPPAYVRPGQTALISWYLELADASPRPLVAYDVPARTGVRLHAATLLEIAAHPRIVAVKDCSADRDAAHAILDDGRLALLAGNDDELFDQLTRGAAGGVCASAHVATRAFVDLVGLVRMGALGEARAAWQRLRPWVRACFAEPNPAPVKAALALQGLIADELRAPMQPAGAGLRDHLATLLASMPVNEA